MKRNIFAFLVCLSACQAPDPPPKLGHVSPSDSTTAAPGTTQPSSTASSSPPSPSSSTAPVPPKGSPCVAGKACSQEVNCYDQPEPECKTQCFCENAILACYKACDKIAVKDDFKKCSYPGASCSQDCANLDQESGCTVQCKCKNGKSDCQISCPQNACPPIFLIGYSCSEEYKARTCAWAGMGQCTCSGQKPSMLVWNCAF